MNAEKAAATHSDPSQTAAEDAREGDYSFYGKPQFHHMLRVERKRTERSKKPFLLVLLDISDLTAPAPQADILYKIKTVLASSLREVDIRGWYDHHRTIGVIFTEMLTTDVNTVERIIHKIYGRFCQGLDAEWVKKIRITFHVYPETNGGEWLREPFNANLYPDLKQASLNEKLSVAAKNVIDLAGAAAALLLFSPLFLVIALAVKATSRGPVFFRQERLGLNGRPFSFLKFRSMYTDSDSGAHRAYITRYIHDQKNAAVEPGVFKLTGDARVTPIGQFLRRTSLDELPQFINVLKGEMSLVGPRPPIPYECELYDIWHRTRLLSCKPGITGLWQVTGRSRTTFDEMVRMDLRYIRERSLGLDLKILFMTPKAVFSGKGAY